MKKVSVRSLLENPNFDVNSGFAIYWCSRGETGQDKCGPDCDDGCMDQLPDIMSSEIVYISHDGRDLVFESRYGSEVEDNFDLTVRDLVDGRIDFGCHYAIYNCTGSSGDFVAWADKEKPDYYSKRDTIIPEDILNLKVRYITWDVEHLNLVIEGEKV